MKLLSNRPLIYAAPIVSQGSNFFDVAIKLIRLDHITIHAKLVCAMNIFYILRGRQYHDRNGFGLFFASQRLYNIQSSELSREFEIKDDQFQLVFYGLS